MQFSRPMETNVLSAHTPLQLLVMKFSSLSRRWTLFGILALTLLCAVSTTFAQSGQQVVSDTFNRADGTLGVANTGQGWTVHNGTPSISSGTLRLGSGFDLASLDSTVSKGSVEIRLTALANEFWLVFRMADTSNYWRFGSQGGAYQLQQIRGNALSNTQISTPATITPQAGDLLRCSLLISGITCSINSTVVATTSDTFGVNATRVGVSGYLASTAQFDDLLVLLPPQVPDLTVSLAGPLFAYTSGSIAWTATIVNDGNSAATSPALRVQPPVGHPTLVIEGLSCTFDGSLYNCPFSTLAPQATVTATIRLFSILATPSLTLTAIAPAVTGETDTSKNSATFTTSVRQPIPSGALVVDTFDRPDGATLGTANTGQTWTNHYEPIAIKSGQAAPGNGFSLSTLEAGTATNKTSVIVAQTAPEFWIVVRFQNSSNYWRFGRSQNQAYQLQQVVNGNLGSPVVTTLATAMPAASDVISCDSTSSLLECSVNGLPVVRTTSTAGNTAIRLGLSTYQSGTALFDDFVVTGPPPVPDLLVTLTGPSIASAGTLASWTASVQNISTIQAQSVELNLTAPTITQPVFTGASCGVAGAGWRCTLSTLAAGQTIAVRMDGAVPAMGTISVAASAPAQPGETVLTNNSATLNTTVRPAIPANALVVDTFDRPDGPTLGPANTGHIWTLHNGTVSIRTSQAAPGSAFALATLNTGTPTNKVGFLMMQPAPEFWMVFRFQDAQNYWRFGRWQQQAYQLQQVVNGALGAPSVTTLATVMPAVADVVSCDNSSAQLECSVNGVIVLRASSTSGNTATRVGIAAYQGENALFDDFYVTGPPPLPDLEVSLAGPSTTLAGTNISWTATVRNLAPIAMQSVELNLTAPLLTQPVFVGATCVPAGTGFRCPLGTLGSEQSASIRMDATTPSNGTIQVTATVPAQTGEVALANNSHTIHTTVRPPFPADAVVIDTFDRPDSTMLGNATTGQAWTQHNAPIGISTGQATPSSGFTLSSIDTGFTSNRPSVIVTQPAAEFWMIVRFQDSLNYWRFGRWQQQAYQLQQIVNGALASPAVTTLSSVMATAGDMVSCNNSYSLLECSVNAVVIVRTMDLTGTLNTRVGLSTYQSPTTRFDDFVVSGPPPIPDLLVTLSGATTVVSGSQSSWTVTVRNVSPLVAQSVQLNLTASSLTQPHLTGASCVAAGAGWTCSLGNLAAGQTTSVQLNGTAPSQGIITLAASTPTLSGEVVVVNNSATFTTNVRQQIPANAVFVDTFDRADSNSLGTATSGQPWTTHYSSFLIRSGMAAPGDGYALASADTGVAMYSVNVTLVTPANEFWLLLRVQDSQNYWRFGRRDQHYQLQSVRGGLIASPIVQSLAVVTPAPGDILNCAVVAAGISCSVNGVNVFTTADPTGQSSTRIGLSAYSSNVARFEDLFVVGPPPAPNVAVTVTTPRYVAMSENYPVEITARNEGVATSAAGTLLVSVPATVTVGSYPAECTPQASSFSCSLPSLTPSQARQLPFSMRSNHIAPVNGNASATVPGDSFSLDNTANWTNLVLPPGSVIEGFDRANTTSGLGTSPSQHVWNIAAPGFRILNGTAQADTAGSVAFLNTTFSFGTMEVALGNHAMTTGILFRVANASNYFRLAADENGFYALRKVINGVVDNLQYRVIRDSVRPATGDVVRIVTRPDDSVFVTVNGRHIIDAGDVALMYEKGWGLASVGGAASANDFFVNPRLEGLATVDNFLQPEQWPLGQPNIGAQYRWREWLGPAWVTLSSRARPVSTQYTYTWIDTSSEQPKVEVKIVDQGQGAWLIFRFNEFDNTYFRYGKSGSTYKVEFMQHDILGAMPVAVQTLASPTPQNGDVVQVYQKPDGTVECSVNGVLTHHFVDPVTNLRWTLNGLASLGTQAAFDDFKVTPFGQ